jgi:hypothetical protein
VLGRLACALEELSARLVALLLPLPVDRDRYNGRDRLAVTFYDDAIASASDAIQHFPELASRVERAHRRLNHAQPASR